MDTLRANVTESAAYIFPGLKLQAQPTPEEQKAWQEKMRRGPSGLMIYT